ncbi:MAG TPA: gamma-glutamyl-gamma-aminobutyrate hydrolase family protein [Gaiellales bacterium]|jgi:CTP synthase (UTP-ammonia lyase)|nr:gamma-glutamyl-gamma-aminobutyrate hydrolase family protein [Gaiellales bacterium]
MAVSIAVLGDRNTDHLTHREIDATLELMPADVDARWLPSLEAESAVEADGLWVVPGTPYRDGEAVLAQIRRSRTAGMPILGTCGGFQHMLVEFARNVAGLADAAHAETDPDAADPVVARLSCSLVGEERPVTAVAGTRVAELCGTEPFTGFHWCSYGLVPEREAALVAAGLVVSARAPDAGVEAVELPGHPFYVATLFQPQVGSSASGRLHPLIGALISAARCADPVARLAKADRLVGHE